MANRPDLPPAADEPRSAATPRAAEQRASRVISRLMRVAMRLALVALVAGAVAWVALQRSLSGSDDSLVVLTLCGLLFVAPPAILLLFAFALAALRSLPQRIREAPATARQRATEIRRHAADAGERRGLLGGIRSIVRLWRSVASVRELADGLGPAALLVTPWMLLATAFAVAGALIEIFLGVVALVALGLVE